MVMRAKEMEKIMMHITVAWARVNINGGHT